MYFFCNRVLSYFAKPNFIVYDEWFDNNLEKTNFYLKNNKITNISKIHDFFHEQSNYKVGASENNLQIDINENREALFNNYYFENSSEKYYSLSNKKFLFFEKITKNKFKFSIKKKIIYSLSIFGFVIILGLLLFVICQSKKDFNYLKKSLISFFIDLYSKLIPLINSSTSFFVFLYSFIFCFVFS